MTSWQTYAVMVILVVLANAPFVNNRLFVFGPLRTPKGIAWRWLEWLCGMALGLFLARLLEADQGQVHAQGWAFYAIMTCLMLTLAFPGFAWRYLRQQSA